MPFSPKMLRFPVLFLMLFFPGVLGTIVLRKMVILSSWSIGEAESRLSPVRERFSPWQLFLLWEKIESHFCIKCWNMKQVVFYGHQNSLHIYSYVIETKRSVIFNALKVLQPCGN